MNQHAAQSSRMDLRLPQEVRDIIDHAATMEGRTRTDFVIAAALERAEQVIERRRVIRLALRDQELLAASLLEDQEREAPQYVKDIAENMRPESSANETPFLAPFRGCRESR
ncbi:MAG: DUF1778 domain-containing protein [Desulfovibrio sp.]|nr:DUF1778 domain-containing protein [Desulfovibrio sp.]